MAAASPPPFIQITPHGAATAILVNVTRVVSVRRWTGDPNGATVDGAELTLDDGRQVGARVTTDVTVAAVLALLNP